MRTSDGYSKMVSAGNGWFTLIGFMGMYTVLSHPVPVPGLSRRSSRDRIRAETTLVQRGGGPVVTRTNMASIWYLIVALMVVAYVVLDGFDLGAGAIHLIAGKNRRRAGD